MTGTGNFAQNSLPEEYKMNCDLEIEYQLDIQATEFHLERQNFQIRLDALTKEYDLRIEQKDIEIALISAESKDQSDANSLNLEKMIQDFELRKRELELKEQELQLRMQNDIDSNAVKREDIQSKRDIAKENANKSG